MATLQLADGSDLDVILTGVVREDRDPTKADYDAKRLFYDGIELRKVIRVPTPGHDREVNFADDVSHLSLLGLGIYADRNTVADLFPFATRETGLRYFRRDQARWELWQEGQYWDTRRSVAEPVDAQGSLWIGEWPSEEDAKPHASRVGQVTSYPNENGAYRLHVVSQIIAGTDASFRYELLPAFQSHALEQGDVEDAGSDVQGTVSGRRVGQGIDAHHVGQYTWRHELRLDYREPQAGVEPQFRVLAVVGLTRIIEFSHLEADDQVFIRDVPDGSIISVGGALFTVASFSVSANDLRLQGIFDEEPVLVDETNYRVRFSAFIVHALTNPEIDDRQSDQQGTVSPRGLNRAVQEYTPDDPPRVSRIPDTEGAPVLYLTHDEHLGGERDLTVTVAADVAGRIGWSAGHDLLDAFGSIGDDDEPGPLLAVYGTGTLQEFTISTVILSSRHLAREIHRIKIGALFYEVLPGFGHLEDLAVVELANPPTLSVPAFTFNIRTAPAVSYYTDGVERTNEAGLWEWSEHRRPRAYERLQDAFENELDGVREATAASGDEFIMRAGSSRHINPARAAGRDVGNLRTAHAGSLSATERWLYAGHGNTGFTRYLVSDNGATRNQGGLAESMENARQSTAVPNSRFGHAIDGNRFYLGFRDGANTSIASWEFDDEEVAQVYPAPTNDLVVLSVPNSHVEELDVITIREGDTDDEVDPGIYMALCFGTGSIQSIIAYRSINGGAFAQWGSFDLGSVLNVGEIIRSVAWQILNEQLLLYVGLPQVGDVNHIVVINTGLNSRIDSARIDIDEAILQGLAVGAVNEDEYLYVSKSNAETEIDAYRAYRYVAEGDLVRVDWPITAQAQQALDSGLRVRDTRQVVGGGVLLASNNFGFDLSGNGTIAVGNYTFDPVPVDDVIDIIATIRVGGRAGFTLRISGEQFRYVGETRRRSRVHGRSAGRWQYMGQRFRNTMRDAVCQPPLRRGCQARTATSAPANRVDYGRQ